MPGGREGRVRGQKEGMALSGALVGPSDARGAVAAPCALAGRGLGGGRGRVQEGHQHLGAAPARSAELSAASDPAAPSVGGVAVLPSPRCALGTGQEVPSRPGKGLGTRSLCSGALVGSASVSRRGGRVASEGRRGSPGGAGAAGSCLVSSRGRARCRVFGEALLRPSPVGVEGSGAVAAGAGKRRYRRDSPSLSILLRTGPGGAPREAVAGALRAPCPPAAGQPPPVYCVCAPVSGDLRLTPALCSLSSLSRCTVLSADFSVV